MYTNFVECTSHHFILLTPWSSCFRSLAGNPSNDCPGALLLSAALRYLEAVTSCSRSAQLGRLLAIGAGTAIGDGCVISQSVVGRGCSIGKNCRLTGCYLQVVLLSARRQGMCCDIHSQQFMAGLSMYL
jgi:hypothetical protein